MVAFESMTSFARVHLCSRENAFHRETVEARVLSQRRTIPSAVAKKDNSEPLSQNRTIQSRCRKTGQFRVGNGELRSAIQKGWNCGYGKKCAILWRTLHVGGCGLDCF